MGRLMAHIAHQPGPVCLEGGVSHWLVGVVGLRAELLQRPHAARGALRQFEVPKKNARCPGLRELLPKAWPGWLSYVPCAREGHRGIKAAALPQPRPCQMCKKKTLVVHVTRW
jgi:hypothetical protein